MLARELAEAEQLVVIEIVAHEVGLHVEDELPGEALGARLHEFGLARLRFVDLKHAAVDFLHGEEGGRHAAAGLHELAAAQAEAPGVDVGQFQDAPFHPLLQVALRGRQILAVRYDLGRYRGCGGSRFGTRDQALFALAEPAAHRHPPLSKFGFMPGGRMGHASGVP